MLKPGLAAREATGSVMKRCHLRLNRCEIPIHPVNYTRSGMNDTGWGQIWSSVWPRLAQSGTLARI